MPVKLQGNSIILLHIARHVTAIIFLITKKSHIVCKEIMILPYKTYPTVTLPISLTNTVEPKPRKHKLNIE